MKKTIITAAAAAAFLLGLATGPALADCKADIDKARGDKVACSSGKADKIDSLLDKAEKALADGNIKRCEKLVKKSRNKIAVC